jgi:hypothetical protein
MQTLFIFLSVVVDYVCSSALGRVWWLFASVAGVAWVSSVVMQYLVG